MHHITAHVYSTLHNLTARID